MRVLICGDRNWAEGGTAYEELYRVYRDSQVECVIEGECRGADLMGRRAAELLKIPVLAFPADWRKGRAAGPIRNQQMIDEGKPDLVLAFHHDIQNSRGTADMVRRARNAGIEVRVIG